MNTNETDLIQAMMKDRILRKAITRRSFRWFFVVFLADYIKVPFAPFHEEMFGLAENQDIKKLVVMSFRGSAKSTILNLGYVLWSILGVQQKKFVIIISKSPQMAKNHFNNLKAELVSNRLLKSDLGPFKESS